MLAIEIAFNYSIIRCNFLLQFPHPLMSPSVRRHGGLIIHIIVAAYMFLGLAIVCDEYFVASLDRICEGKIPLGRTIVAMTALGFFNDDVYVNN